MADENQHLMQLHSHASVQQQQPQGQAITQQQQLSQQQIQQQMAQQQQQQQQQISQQIPQQQQITQHLSQQQQQQMAQQISQQPQITQQLSQQQMTQQLSQQQQIQQQIAQQQQQQINQQQLPQQQQMTQQLSQQSQITQQLSQQPQITQLSQQQQQQQQQLAQQIPQQQQITQQLSQQQMNQQLSQQQQITQQLQPQQQQISQQIQQQQQQPAAQQQQQAVTVEFQPTVSVPASVMSHSNTHPTMIHSMSMSQSPLQQVQVLQQQPLSASYLQHVYPPQQIMFPGNLQLHNPTLQSISPQGISLQLQTKTNMDPKTSAAVNAAHKAISLSAMTTGQMIGTGTKANFQQQIMTAPGKSAIIHGQAQFAPANANQTVVIGPVGVQQAVYNQKTITDSQKSKTYMVNQPATLQPKSPIYSSLPAQSTAQIFNGNQIKHLSSSPQLITSQGANAFNQTQLFSSLQALNASLPQGLSWTTTPAQLQSSAILAQNPIFIRSQQSDMFIQSPTQTVLPVATATAQLPATSYASATLAPPKPKLGKRPANSSVGTQTAVASSSTANANTPLSRPQTCLEFQPKVKSRTISSHLTPPTPVSQASPQMATSQTQTQTNQQQQIQASPQNSHIQQQQNNQLIPPSTTQQQVPPHVLQQPPPPLGQQLKADATNHIKPVLETKSISIQSKNAETETKLLPLPKSQAKVAPSTKFTTDVITSVAPTVVSCSTSPIPPVSEPQSASTEDSISSATTNLSTGVQVQSSTQVVENKGIIEKENVAELKAKPIEIPHAPEIRSLSHSVKDKQPQKAIVKPQVLTHIIDGYIIQEGPEPFPVGRSSLLTEASIPKPTTRRDVANGVSDASKVAPAEKKKKIRRVRGPVELAKCEFCGKMGAKSKFKRSKRFCSTSCAKRYNVHCSKRLGLLSPSAQEKMAAGKGSKKKKVGRKGWKKTEEVKPVPETQEEPMEESLVKPTEEMEEDKKTKHDENLKGESETEVVLLPSSPVAKDALDVDMEDISHPACPLSKWSVQEVFDYIRKIVGSDYADEFRSQEIDGQALLLLKEDHLMTAMKMKLGPALKLISHINGIKEEATPS